MAKVEKSWQRLIEDQTITEPERLSEAADKLLGGADINEVFQIGFGIEVTPLINAIGNNKYDLVWTYPNVKTTLREKISVFLVHSVQDLLNSVGV